MRHNPNSRKPEDAPDEPKQLTAALRALAAALAPLVAAELAKGSPPLGQFSQADGERPPGCGPAKYARTWRKAWAAGDPGATKNGRARLLTAEAFDRHAPAEVAPPPAAQPIELSDDEQALEALGLRRAS